MTPGGKAHQMIDARLEQSGWIVQDFAHFQRHAAVGVTSSKKTQTQTLERKPAVSLTELMRLAGGGSTDEDVLTSLANRINRLNQPLTPKEQKEFAATVGVSPNTLAKNLFDAFDEDVILEKVRVILEDDRAPTPQEQERMDMAQKELIEAAILPFDDPDIRDYIENLRRSHEQIIDSVNLDTVLFAGFDADKQSNADRVIQTFRDLITANQDEITALRIIYDQQYKDRPMAIEKLKALYEKLKAKGAFLRRNESDRILLWQKLRATYLSVTVSKKMQTPPCSRPGPCGRVF